MNVLSDSFRADEVPTTPRGLPRRTKAARTAWSVVEADELPTTLRRSPPPPPPIRRTPPPPLPARPRPVHHQTPPRDPLPSLASVLEPSLWFPSRPVLVPPDPEVFRPEGAPSFAKRHGSELRWVVRVMLLMVIVAGELVLADPSGALHAPRDFADGRAMITEAARASVSNALTR